MARKEVTQSLIDYHQDVGLSADRELLVPEAGIRTCSGDPVPFPVGAAVTGASTATTVTASGAVTGASVVVAGANGQAWTRMLSTELLLALEGATVEAEDIIPAGARLYAVDVLVVTAITGATSFDVGDGSTADRWGDDLSVDAETQETTQEDVPIIAAATSVILTANGSDFLTGAVRVTVFYETITGATS